MSTPQQDTPPGLRKFSWEPVAAELAARLETANAQLAAERAIKAELVAALEEIAKGEGAFNRVPIIHAENVIERAISLASAALEKASK